MEDRFVRDRVAITDVCRSVSWFMDTCAWDELRRLFADRVRLDYSSLTGAPGGTVDRDVVLAGWRRNREAVAATQHLISNQLVQTDGDVATASATVQATHYLPNPSGSAFWRIVGRYYYHLVRSDDGWQIDGLTLVKDWAEGNEHVRYLARDVSDQATSSARS